MARTHRLAEIRADGSACEIDCTDSQGRTGRFDAVLGRIGELVVLDIVPSDLGSESSKTWTSRRVPG